MKRPRTRMQSWKWAEWVIFKQIHLWKERGPKRKKQSAKNSQLRKNSQKSEQPNIQSIMYEEIN